MTEQVCGAALNCNDWNVACEVLQVARDVHSAPSDRLYDLTIRTAVNCDRLNDAMALAQEAYGVLPSQVHLGANGDVVVPPSAPTPAPPPSASAPPAPASPSLPSSAPAAASRSLTNLLVDTLCAGPVANVWDALRLLEQLRLAGTRPSPATFLPVLRVLADSSKPVRLPPGVPSVPAAAVFLAMRAAVSTEASRNEACNQCARLAMQAALTTGDFRGAIRVLGALQTDTGRPHCSLSDRLVQTLLQQDDDGLVRDAYAVTADTVSYVTPSSKDKPGRRTCKNLVAAMVAAGMVHEALALVSSLVRAGVAVSKPMVGAVCMGMLTGSPTRPADPSMALGFALGLSVSRRLPLDGQRFNALLGNMVQLGRLQDAQLLLQEMAALGEMPDPARLVALFMAFRAAGLDRGAKVTYALLQDHYAGGSGPDNVRDVTPRDLLAAVTSAKLASPRADRDALAEVVTALLRSHPPHTEQAVDLLESVKSTTSPGVAACVTLLRTCLDAVFTASQAPAGDTPACAGPHPVGAMPSHARHVDTLRRAVEYVDDMGITPDTPQGRTALIKAYGRAGMPDKLLPAFEAAMKDGVADTRLCNTALSQLLFHGRKDDAQRALDVMTQYRVPQSPVTASLVTKLRAVA